MSSRTGAWWSMAGVAALAACVAQAGPLEDARAKLKAGLPHDVDGVLAGLLEQRPPSLDALLLSFDAAVADGRLYTAERRAIAVLDRKEAPPASFLFRAADVAALLGKSSIQLDRLAYFLQLEQGATPEAQAALATLCREGLNPSHLARYVKQFGGGPEALDLGLRMLRRMRDTGKPADYPKLANAMLGEWRDSDDANRIFAEMHAALSGRLAGLDADALFELLARHPLDDPGLIGQWVSRSEWTPQRALRAQETAYPDKLAPPALLDRVRGVGNVPDAERADFARRLWALEPRFRAAGSAWHARLLFETVASNPDAFLKGEAPVVTSAQMFDLALHVAKLSQPDWGTRRGFATAWQRVPWDAAQRRALAERCPEFLNESHVVQVYGKEIAEAKDAARLKALIAKHGARPELRWAFFDTAVAVGDKALVVEALRSRVLADPAGFDPGTVRAFLANSLMTVDERVAAVNACFQTTGYSPAWKRVVEERNLPVASENAWKTFAATVKPGAKAGDAFLGALVEMSAQGYQSGGRVSQSVRDLAKRAVAAFEGTAPDPARPYRTAAFELLLSRYRDIIRDNRACCREAVGLFLPKLGKGGNFGAVADLARRGQDADGLYAVAKARLASEGTYASWLADVTEPEGSAAPLYARFYAEMGPEAAAEYVARNHLRWSPAVAAREIASLFATHPVDSLPGATQTRAMDAVLTLSAKPEAAVLLPLDALAVRQLDGLKGTTLARERLLQAFRAAGKRDAAVTRYLAAGQKLAGVARQRHMAYLVHWTDAPSSDTPYLSGPTPPAPPSPGSLAGVTFGPWTEALKALAVGQRPLAVVSERHVRHLERHRNAYGQALTAELAAAFDAVDEAVMRAIADGGVFWGTPSRVTDAALRALRAALARGDKAGVARLCRSAALCFDRGRTNEYKEVLDALGKADLWECAYALADRSETDDPAAQSMLSRFRAEAAARMPGVYPVPENDPAYPLFVAADELQRRNPERAWTLLRAHAAVFERDPLRYPPQFVAWAVEQFRIVRGDRDVLQHKAKALIDAMLAQERSLPPELVASLMLTRAEIARDRRLFDAARAEYQSIRNHPAYQKTPAGRQAMFRDVDLMVAMGNAAAAEQTVEQWMSVPDPEVQAQAHYTRARLAFDRQDYDETRRQLELVFAIDFTHTEARLLHGKWKLATNYEVDDTQVLVGDLADRTLIRPGQPLTITVQDRNLGVAGGGATIPVVLTTSAGADRETLSLYPSTRDPFLFRGTIDTALAGATPGNHVLDVRGQEVVSYAVDTDFLKARGLAEGASKRLRVVDDAVMAVGAAVPDAEEGRAESELERELAGESFDPKTARSLTSNLRPGSPIHVAVRDRDRSVTDGLDSVSVSVSTSSGDRVENVPLAEATAFTGVFRGAIPTRLPPPRASASDSAAGVNPGDTINRKRDGLWRSLPDGRKGKWFDVDTMASHLVSSATLAMPSTADIVLLRLYGRLAGGEQLLASFPADAEGEEGGIRVQGARMRFRNASDMRRHFLASDRVARRLDDWRIDATGKNQDQGFLLRGAICPPVRQRVRLRFDSLFAGGSSDGAAGHFSVRWSGYLQPRKTGPHKLGFSSDDGVRVWVDGKLVIDAWKEQGETETIADVALTAGQRVPLRIEYFQGQGDGAAHFRWTEPGAAHASVPAECLFRAATGPETGLAGDYFQGIALKGEPQMRRTDAAIAFASWPEDLFAAAKPAPDIRELRRRAAAENRLMATAWVQLVMDGNTVFTGSGAALLRQVIALDLEAEPHLLEVFASARSAEDAFRLAMEEETGTIVPLPSDWCDPAEQPALAAFLSPKAQLERHPDRYVATFATPLRLRALRWEFTDFVGNEVAVRGVAVLDADGREIIPCDGDYSDALANDTLEVAPGDKVTVTYRDDETSRGETRVVERSLNASFHDAKISFLFEELSADRGGRPEQRLHEAYRFQVGDTLLLRVEDPDMDRTPGIDSVTVRVAAKGGKTVDVVASEQASRKAEGVEGGVFLAMLRTLDAGDPAAANAPKDTIPVTAGEGLEAVYLDRENTDPGIPVERSATVRGVVATTPALVLHHAWRERIEDQSEDAKIRLAQIRRRPGNERVETVWRDTYWALEMDRAALASAEPLPVNASLPIPISVDDASRARHAASTLTVDAVTLRELKAAEAEGREPVGVAVALRLDAEFDGFHLKSSDTERIALLGESERFSGLLRLRFGEQATSDALTDEPFLPVVGNDTIRLRVPGQNGQPGLERILRLVSSARVDLTDSTYVAERKAVHLGEKFHVSVDDPDRDVSEAQDSVEVTVTAEKGGVSRTLTLTETMPNSGRFTGVVRPVFFGAREVPAELGDQLPVAYGDTVLFRYQDEQTLPLLTAGAIETRGTVFKGADGTSRVFSKRFRDADQAVLVQFRLAECLFETAKEYRRLKQPEKSTAAIAEGREILEAALRDYPGTSHAVQGEYLLANLYQELAAEQKQGGDTEAARPLYQEALARFSAMLATWPEGEYAARAQYHKALCLEMLEDYARASEEYVKMTYLFPESPLVGDAAIRLATYYYAQEKRYDTAGRIYANFQRRFPAHPRAARALFMGAQCHIKQAEVLMGTQAGQGRPSGLALYEYKAAIEALTTLADTYKESGEKDLRAQALYWAGDSSFRIGDYPNAYLFLKRTVFEYPETEWARRARGMLLQESKAFETLD